MKTIQYAPDALKRLNGFFCVYKPSAVHHLEVKRMVAGNLCRDLNSMEVRPAKGFVTIEGSAVSGKPLSINVTQNFADHPLVVGPRYQPQDFRIKSVSSPGRITSGVMVMAINDDCWKAMKFQESNPLQTIEVKGMFGLATHNFMHDGKVAEKATFHKIRREFMDRIIASIQASQQAAAFNFSGVPLESQEAYELASHGVVRPSGKSPTLLYDIRCTEFNLPYFTLQMQCINQTEEYIAGMIHQIGIYLRSCAVCCQIRCLRYGHFTLDHALLRKHWTLQHILGNAIVCKEFSEPDSWNSNSAHFKPVPKHVSLSSLEKMRESWRNEAMES